jgi:hypothetical protein
LNNVLVWIPMVLFLVIVIIFSIRMGLKVRFEKPDVESLWSGEQYQTNPTPLAKAVPFEELNQVFLESIEGREAVDFIRVYSPQESTVLRSLLRREGILSYASDGHLRSSLESGQLSGSVIPSQQNTVISIMAKDLNSAYSLVQEYLDQERHSIGKSSHQLLGLSSGKVRGYVIPQRTLPELLVKDFPFMPSKDVLKL